MKMILNDEQQKAAFAPTNENTYVDAGAGAGKTRVLVARIVHMMQDLSISPSNILAITYTRKAAKEMKERLVDIVGSEARKVTMTTIHGFCLSQLFRFGDRIGWRPENMSVFSESESKDMLNFVLEDLGFRKNRKRTGGPTAKEIKKAFLNLESKNEMPAVEDEDLRLIIHKFFNDCREANCLTYSMILMEFFRLISSSDEVRDRIKYEFQYCLMDEVQDTTPIQWKIARAFARNIFAVGDLRQSIFSFAGSSPGNTAFEVQNFNHERLSYNYRSGEKIVEAGNKLMPQPIYPEMVPKRVIPGEISFTKSDSKNIHHLILAMIKKGYKYDDIALLCRAHRPLAKSVQALRQEGHLVYYPKEKANMAENPETKLLHSYLALQINHYDTFAFRKLASELNIDPVTIQEIRLNTSFHDGIDLAKSCFDLTGICLHDIPFEKVSPETRFFVLDNIDRFQGTQEEKISNYLKWHSMRDLHADQEEIPEGHIQALSIHQSKGLEFPCVILIGASEGILPSSMSKSHDDIEEEKRLFYVAATRAEETFVVSPRIDGQDSRFVNVVK